VWLVVRGFGVADDSHTTNKLRFVPYRTSAAAGLAVRAQKGRAVRTARRQTMKLCPWTYLWMISPSASVRRVFGILGLDAVLTASNWSEVDMKLTVYKEW
jgi:hypothetical protein